MGLPSYIINFDELSDLIKDYLQNGIDVDIASLTFSTEEVEKLLSEISSKIQGVDYTNLIAALNALGAKLDALNGNLGISGTQKVYGEMLEVISTSGAYEIKFTAPAKGRITGITYSLSAWNHEDSWDLLVGTTKLFTKVRTKEYGEHKHFNVYYPITAGQDIRFVYNNTSGSSCIVWVDFSVLED
ncbi:hypothetical protein JOC70_000762 [Clostridium pascui]|uniref:hypothetical protein n=1 Tax=Clostridium pascui TaxID=46609 RepID=UPI00195C9A9D|nr:hypothetical protein [Clostridium pascui]MBM7869293.1 hypothetical protein [Clostridium pascui]